MGVQTKYVVTVSRKWNSPEILVWVNDTEIGMGMALDDFLVAMTQEIGNPALILTQSGLLAKMRTAAPVVEAEMREKSTLVM